MGVPKKIATKAPEPPSDAELVGQLAAGDVSALGALYDTYAKTVRGFAMRSTGDLTIAEDVTHDTFIALVDAAKRYDAAYPARSFIIGIAGKLVLRRRRKMAVAFRVLSDLRKWVRRADERTPETQAGASEELERFQAALARLSPAKRVTLMMADVEGLSGNEIAQALDIPVGTVWTRLHHARTDLRHALREVPR